MPRELPDFTGRRREIEVLLEWLKRVNTEPRAANVLVLSGFPGIGTSTLPIQLGHEARESYEALAYLRLRTPDGKALTSAQATAKLLGSMAGGETEAHSEDIRAALLRERLGR